MTRTWEMLPCLRPRFQPIISHSDIETILGLHIKLQKLCWTLDKLHVLWWICHPLTYLNLHGRDAYYFVYPAALFQELPPPHGSISRVAAAFAIFFTMWHCPPNMISLFWEGRLDLKGVYQSFPKNFTTGTERNRSSLSNLLYYKY